jgi:probable HAF family extracellular repeat protein
MRRTIPTIAFALAFVFSLAFVPWAAADIERINLGSPADCQWSVARAVNVRGDAAGLCSTWGNRSHAALWQDGTFTDLRTLGGSDSFASGINVRGQVVGYSTTAAGVDRAFLWENGTMTDLGTLGGTYSVAYGINNDGEIVGQSQTADGADHAFLWDDGMMIDLGTLGGVWSTATEPTRGVSQVCTRST